MKGQSAQPQSTPPDPGGGVPNGNLHEIIERIKKEFEAQGKPVDEKLLYEHAYKEIHPNKPLTAAGVKSQYENRNASVRPRPNEVSTSSDLRKAAGLPAQGDSDGEVKWPDHLDGQGSDESGEQSGQVGTAPESNVGGQGQENQQSGQQTKGQETPTTTDQSGAGTEETQQPKKQVDGVAPKTDASAAGEQGEGAAAEPKPKAKAKSDDKTDFVAPEEQKAGAASPKKKDTNQKKDDTDKKEAPGQEAEKKPEHKPTSQAKGKSATQTAAQSTGAQGKNALMPRKIDPEQAKQVMSQLTQPGGVKEGVKFVAQQGADKAFWVLLDASPADLGIATIGIGGTSLLVLGHMFDVKLQSWQKYLILAYDGLLLLIILFAIVILMFVYCNTPPAMFYPSCWDFSFVNALL